MNSDIKFYTKLVKKRLPVMVLLFLMSAIAGVVMSQRLPTLYETSARLLIEGSQIDTDPLTIEVKASEQLEVIQQRLMTRANLLDTARDTQVLPGIREMSPDEIVEAMREATTISRSSGRDRAPTMTVGFEGQDPRKVAAVVNRYVTLILETNAEQRKQATVGAQQFFDTEVRTISADLDAKSAEIAAFKQQNSDALPENLDYRLNRQAQLQEQIARAERELESLRSQRASFEEIYKATGALSALGGQPQTQEERDLLVLEAELRAALGIYSEQNPKVRNLRARVEAARKTVQAVSLAGGGQSAADPQTTVLEVRFSELDADIAALSNEVATANAQLDGVTAVIEKTPLNGIALGALEREYESLQRRYESALANQQQAQRDVRLDVEGIGGRLSLLESANVPSIPSSPNRPAVMALGVAAGLGLAAGLFFLLELLNQSIRRPVDIERMLEITPLATVPMIESQARRRMRRLLQILMLLVVVVGVPAALWAIDSYYLPLDLIIENIQDKLF